MTQSKSVIGPVFYWMYVSQYGHLLEVQEDSPYSGINGMYGYDSKEKAIQGYADWIEEFQWSSPTELVLTERYQRDVRG